MNIGQCAFAYRLGKTAGEVKRGFVSLVLIRDLRHPRIFRAVQNKATCANCRGHCYTPIIREKIREVMRYAGLPCSPSPTCKD
ncbi:MAG: nitrous oxide-stimulated promoter family protein [Nitrospirota bacterium]